MWDSFLASGQRSRASLSADSKYEPAVGLRAIAMLWVFWFHGVTTTLPDLGEYLRLDDPSGGWPLGVALKHAWYPLGFAMAGDCGVDLFLVLSGFLLGTMLSSEIAAAGSIKILRFYCRRWFRIVPSFASAIVVSMFVINNERQPQACPALWWSNLMFMSNIFPMQNLYWGPSCVGHTWSIAVEFQMYLVSPLLMLLGHQLSRVCKTPVTVGYLAVLTFGWLMCVYMRDTAFDPPSHVAQPYTATRLRAAPYLAGMATAIAVRQYHIAPYSFPGTRARLFATILSWTTLLLISMFGAETSYFAVTDWGEHYVTESKWRVLMRVHNAWGRPVLGAAVGYLLGSAITGHAPLLASFLSARAWRPLAVLSYSLYLFQYVGMTGWKPIYAAFLEPHVDIYDGRSSSNFWFGAALAHAKAFIGLGCTLPIAIVNYCLIEHPLQLYGRTVGDWLDSTPSRGPSHEDKLELQETSTGKATLL